MGEDAEEASEEPPEKEELAGVQEAEMAMNSPEVLEEGCEEATGVIGGEQVDLGELPDHEEKSNQKVAAATLEDCTQDEPAEESCQIVLFQNNCMDNFVTSLRGSPYEFFPTKSTSFCRESCSPFSESVKSLESEQAPKLGLCAEEDPVVGALCGQHGPLQDGAAEGPTAPDVVVLPKAEEEEVGEEEKEEVIVDDTLANPYVMGVGLPGRGGEEEEEEVVDDTLASLYVMGVGLLGGGGGCG